VLADRFGGGFFLGEGWVLHVFQLHHIKIIVFLEELGCYKKLSPPWGSSPTRHLLKGPGMKECSQLTSSSDSKFCNDKNSEQGHT